MKKQMKKKIAAVLAAGMLLTTMPQGIFAKDYENHWANTAITKWKDKGIIKGFEDGTFRPKEEITRAQLASVIVRLFGLTETKLAKNYTDIDASAWYAADIAKISSADIMYIEGNKFKPNAPATREEAAYAIAQAYKVTGKSSKDFKDEASIATWALDAVDALATNGYINGTPEGNFNPQGTLTRAELITIIDNTTSEVINQAGTYTQDVEGNLVVNARDVVLKDMTIKGDLYLAEGIGDGDVYLEGITVEGEVFIDGGGENSIKSKDSEYYNSIKVSAANPVRVVIEGDAVRIEAYPGTNITLTGNFEDIMVSPDVNMNIKDATVNTIIVAATEAEGAKTPVINIDKTATVNKVQADAAVDISGKGTVKDLVVNATDVKIEQKPNNTTIADKDIVVNIGGKDQTVESIKPEKPSTGGGGSDSGNDDSDSDNDNDNNNNGEVTPSRYRVSGTVTYEGAPVEHARVNIFDEKTNEMIATTTTAKNGSYYFYVKPGQSYWIEAWIVSEEGYGYHVSKTDNYADGDKEIYLQLIQRHVANINVVDANDVPVREVKVRPVINGRENRWSHTDNEGNVTLYMWDENATYGFNFYLEGELIHQIPESIKTEADKKVDLKVDLTLGLGNKIVGKLVDQDGNPISGGQVDLYKVIKINTKEHRTEWVGKALSNKEGEYTLDIGNNKASYQVRATYKDEKGNTYSTDKLNALMVDQVALEMRQAYGVNITVVDKNNIPIQDAEVRINHANGGDSTTHTREDGKVDFYSYYTEPGKHILEVTVGGEVQLRSWQVTEGKYNYSETFKFDNIDTGKRAVQVNVAGDSVTIGDKTVKPYEVSVRGEGWSLWGVLEKGKVTIAIPKDIEDKEVEAVVYSKEGIRIYKESIELVDGLMQVELDIMKAPKYDLTGNVYLDGQVTTGAAITVQAEGFNWECYSVAERESDETVYEVDNLLDDAYLVQTTYTTSGAIYMSTDRVNPKYRGGFDIQLYPVVATTIELVDTAGQTMSNIDIEVVYVKLNQEGKPMGEVWQHYETDNKGQAHLADGIPLPQKIRVRIVGRDSEEFEIESEYATIEKDSMTIRYAAQKK